MIINSKIARDILESTSVRSLLNHGIVKPSKDGYTFDQLVFMRVMILLREKLNYRNFNFATNLTYLMSELEFNSSDLLIYLDNGLVLIPSVNNDIKSVCDQWLLPKNQEIFSSELSRKDIETLIKDFKVYGNNSNMLVIPLYRVRNYIHEKIESICEDSVLMTA